MGNALGVIYLVIGMVIGLIPFYLMGQQDWMAIIVLGAVMFTLDMLTRIFGSTGPLTRMILPSSGGSLVFLPSWAWGAAAFVYAVNIRFIELG